MKRNLYVVVTVFILSLTYAAAQTGSIQGRILDSAKNEGIPFANVIAEQNGNQVGGAATDFDGNYVIKPLEPGRYDIKVSYTGFGMRQIAGVPVSPDKITFQDIIMSSTIRTLGEFTVTDYARPIIDKGGGPSGDTRDAGDIKDAGLRSIPGIVGTVAGAHVADNGEIEIRGQRPEGTKYMVDGIPVIGSPNISRDGIEQIEVMVGGIPAKIGDVSGGVVSLTTKGPSKEYSGGISAESSYFLDKFNSRLISFNLSGPLFTRMDAKAKKKVPLAGFFLVGEYSGALDGSPSYVGTYKVNDATLHSLENNPIRLRGIGQGYNDNSDYVTGDQIDHLAYKNNSISNSYSLSGKLDFKPSQNTDFVVGGSVFYEKQHVWQYVYSVYNSFNNPLQLDNTERVFARFTQRFNPDTSAKAVIKNAFYSIQVDYSQTGQTVKNDQYGDQIFNYGYVGKFQTYKDKTYSYGQDTASHLNGWLMTTYQDTMVKYTPGTVNPITSKYDEEYYQLAGDDKSQYRNLNTIQANGGLLNGDRPHNVYGLWYNTGRVYNGYTYYNNNQFRVSANGSADIGKHAITLGFEYEQRSNSKYNIGPIGLWTLMRQLANQHITQLNKADTQLVRANDGTFLDTVNYGRFYDAAHQANFDKNLRKKLGMAQNGTNWIDIDSYDPSTFTLDMFSADELYNNNSSYASWYGYDYLGNKLTSNPSFNDFFTQKDAKTGNYTRAIGAFKPIYMAGYIQDKFVFNDLIFNIGVRVDRYDANQKVIKDPYSLYATHTAGDTKTAALRGGSAAPSNIGGNYVTYVNDINSPSAVVGYRDPATNLWYDAAGNQINDPGILAKSSATGSITPYLINSTDDIKSPNFVPDNSFVNYSPALTVMPRIAFSFPISDEALFFAHYDVLTQRPSTNLSYDPSQMIQTDYFFMAENSGKLLNNANLQPERTTDYELGFKQKLSRSSSFTLSAFYRELRNNIETVNILDAYPVTYKTYMNVDFGTVKGLTLSYDLRRTQNIRMTASYTLQFANGTGSGAQSGYNIINLGEPNLVVPQPLSFDQRHSIVTSVDYRFGSGVGEDAYTGPVVGGKKILKSTGFNFIFHAGSGTPYTKQSNINETGDFTLSQRTDLTGTINGSRLPWQFKVDMKIDRDITIKTGKKNGEDKKLLFLNIYLQINNLLNAENVISVYAATGNAGDDGYLSAAQNQVSIQQQVSSQSFTDLYRIKINDPGHYSQPRQLRLGASLNF